MKRILTKILLFSFTILCLCSCANQNEPSPANPVTLTMWHVYGSQTESPLNNAIDEFNRTVGVEKGITINVVSVTSSSAIDKALAASAMGEPGAEDMPDLFTAYPRVAEIVGIEKLLRWDKYFTEEELSLFHNDFLSEGYFDNQLLMLPIAKSTEALFINQTLFDRFCNETGTSISALNSFEGLFQVVRDYYDWSGGQNFMQFNDYYNYAYIGMKAYGSELIRDNRLQLDDSAFEKVWIPLAQTAIYGGICLEDGYAASRWKTVEIIANTGSTADVLYQPKEVIYSDNTSESIDTLALPYPTFSNNNPGAIYRGGGLFATKSEDERKNRAAYIFAKWLTEEANNLNFVTQAGYLPVTDNAFNTLFSDINVVKNKDYHSVYNAVDTMIQNYNFYALPLYENASEIQLDFESNVKTVLKIAHNQYIKRINEGENPSTVMEELITNSLYELKKLSNK